MPLYSVLSVVSPRHARETSTTNATTGKKVALTLS